MTEIAQRSSPKSQRTRQRLLDCMLELLAAKGMAGANTADIAEAAGITRGAMLYHFPTREDLVGAVIEHIQVERARQFEQASDSLPPGADVTEHAIDSYWNLIRQPAFVAFRELEHAARSDAVVARLIAASQADFDRGQIGDHFMQMLHAGPGPRFQASRDFARFLLEGLAVGSLTYDQQERTERLLTLVKRATHMLNRKGGLSELWPD